ncbi:MAG: AtpZ/AtpI family protein [Armatimonadetes bacterium]|nr:AtpZ/AtpI family protein [Armatimonadota bacterium]
MFDREAVRALGQFGALGFTLAAGVMLFAAAGMWVDRRFDCAPVGVAVLGLLGAVLSLVKLVRDVQRQTDH